jgi:hypothetical protein
MATGYGIRSTLVTSNQVWSVALGSYDSIVTAETGNVGPNGGYQIKTTYTGYGCSSSGIYIELSDSIPWTNITYELILEGNSACWTFNENAYAPGSALGNLLTYDESAGDRISRPLNSWEIPAFQSHAKTSACDNNSNNFYHGSFNTNNPKTFFIQRRRNVNGSKAGPQIGRACTGTGTTIIRNIRIW